MSTKHSSNPMRDQVVSIPELIREQIWLLESRTRKILTTPEIFGTCQIILTGCGDSYFSAMAAEDTFVQLACIPTMALNAMQASRYHAPHSDQDYPRNPLVLAVSNSGEVARVVEAVKNYGEQDALTLAISGNVEGRLAQQADRIVQTTIPPFASSPGVRSFTMNLLTLYLIAIRLGEVRGNFTMDQAMAYRKELKSIAETIEKTIEATDSALKKLAEEWKQCAYFELLGSGSDRATAAYGAAKLLEAAGVHAVHQDVEEWVHLQYFVRDARNTATLVIAPEQTPAMSRVNEIEPLLLKLERPHIVLTSKSCTKQFRNALALPDNIRPLFAPLVYSMPVALFAAYLSEELNETYGRGATGPWADCANGMTTRNSEIL